MNECTFYNQGQSGPRYSEVLITRCRHVTEGVLVKTIGHTGGPREVLLDWEQWEKFKEVGDKFFEALSKKPTSIKKWSCS